MTTKWKETQENKWLRTFVTAFDANKELDSTYTIKVSEWANTHKVCAFFGHIDFWGENLIYEGYGLVYLESAKLYCEAHYNLLFKKYQQIKLLKPLEIVNLITNWGHFYYQNKYNEIVYAERVTDEIIAIRSAESVVLNKIPFNEESLLVLSEVCYNSQVPMLIHKYLNENKGVTYESVH